MAELATALTCCDDSLGPGQEGFLVETDPAYGGSFIGGVEDMDSAVLRLDGSWIGEGAWPPTKVHLMGEGPDLVGRKRRGKGAPVVHAPIVDKEEMAALKFDQLDGGVWVWEFGFFALAPSQPSVVRFGSDDGSVVPGFVIPAPATKCQEMTGIKLDEGWLEVS